MELDLFTALMRSEFLKGMQAVPKRPLRYKEFTLELPSTARTENYGWMTPSPGMSRYLGHRRYAQLDQIKYTVTNLEFDSSVSVALRDVEDDQIGGYPIRFKELGAKANVYPGQAVLQALAAGASTGCFDGTNYFATAHNFGTGNSTLPSPFGGGLNSLTYTSANTADAATFKCAFLIKDGSGGVRPVGWQNRKPPRLGTNSGESRSIESKQVNYWVDLEGASFFGYWWDAIMVTITNTPNLTDIFTIMDQVMKQFWSFKLPAALSTDPAQYVHQDMRFTAADAVVVCSTGLGRLFDHALNEDRVGVSVAGSTSGITSNIYKGAFDVLTTGYFD